MTRTANDNSHRRLVREGDPSTTTLMEEIEVIAALTDHFTKLYVTASWWTRFVAELKAQYADRLLRKGYPAPWDYPNFDSVMMGKLQVINAGTDDERVVNLRNTANPDAIDFKAKRERLRVSRERLRVMGVET